MLRWTLPILLAAVLTGSAAASDPVTLKQFDVLRSHNHPRSALAIESYFAGISDAVQIFDALNRVRYDEGLICLPEGISLSPRLVERIAYAERIASEPGLDMPVALLVIHALEQRYGCES